MPRRQKVKSKRNRLTIFSKILTETKLGVSKTRIKCKVNLNYQQLEAYIQILLEKKLLTKKLDVNNLELFFSTEKGKRFVKTFQEFHILHLT